MQKISLIMIVKNDAAGLEHCLKSARPHVDEIVCVDTGSTDSTPEVARRLADKVATFTGCNDAEGRIADFSAARNFAWALGTHDVALWLDSDDELVTNPAAGPDTLRKLASEAPRGPSGAFSVVAPYEYDHDAQGRVTVLQWRERLVGPRDQWEWRGPIHEGLLGKPGCEPVTVQTDAFHVKHRRRQLGKAADPERNLRILRAWFAANGDGDVRLMHYFGAELFHAGQYGPAMYWLRRHAQGAPWSDERCLSLLLIATFHLSYGDSLEAIRYASEASWTKTWPEPLWLMGKAFDQLAGQGVDATYNLKRAAHFLERGFELAGTGPTSTLLMTNPTERYSAHATLASVYERMGNRPGAIKHGELMVAGMPERKEWADGLTQLKAEATRDNVRAALVELHKMGALTQEGGVAIEQVLRGNYTKERHPMMQGNVHREQPRQLEPLPGGKLRIAFWLGHQIEPWTPETLERDGMGGSETMAWELSKRLAKLGHDVTVFGHCAEAGQYNGVFWLDASQFEHTECDVLIVSRQAPAVNIPHSAIARVLWVHDVHVGPDFTPQLAQKYDFIWCLSEWHKRFFCETYPWLPKEKVEVTRNGIDVDRFRGLPEAPKRNPHRAIYSSSPDRGLAEAVAAWPAVRAAIPDAELHCFYGFAGWRRSIELAGENGIEQCSKAALVKLEKACAETEGVYMRGRIDQKQLAQEMLSSSVWAYGTWFSETSCITAMEAQAAGLHCVCPPLAALAETVLERRWTGDLAADIIAAMQAPFATPIDAEQFSLDQLALRWEDRLQQLVEYARLHVVPRFHEAAQ